MAMRFLYPLLFLIFAAITPLLQAQQGSPSLAGVPPQILPIIKHIEARYTPEDLMKMVQTASPTGWKLVQEKARLLEAGKIQGFTMTDVEKLPQKEQQALIAAFQPVLMDAVNSLTPEEQMRLLAMAKDFDPNTLVHPVMNLLTKKDPKK